MQRLTPEVLASQAEMAERLGRKAEADRIWQALIDEAPDHQRAAYARGRRFLEAGDAAAALPLLQTAEAKDRKHAETPLYIALAHRMLGDLDSALAAIDRALALDPYFFVALISKASLLEAKGKPRAAARCYADAIKIAPSLDALGPTMRIALSRAQSAVAQNASALAEHLHRSTAHLRPKLAGERLERFDESLDIVAGLKRRYVHDPILFYYPGLPATTFYDRSLFPWLKTLEAATPVIVEELEAVLREDSNRFSPYIQLPPEAPVNQWRQLNHSMLWSTFHLWRDGVRQDANCIRCPRTAALLEQLPMAHQQGFGPTALFSVLSPHTTIPPHTGSTNVRLLTHLPLILPPNCRFRVGNHVRQWRMGEAWVFDDSIDHEAWNDSDETRVILIFDVWNPLVREPERTLISALMLALKAYNAD
ncbi:MAG: aspartyl/asparaginyl beta-hydroxylase domain-containing protein [Hyphomonadaceae bacterium]|nr:aspartyl/asparaginyl beta-hydroxylase domain-containing protein [Hyphomonadaceae bacterium]